MTTFKPGKLPPEFLGKLLKRNRIRDKRVLIGPCVGEDAAAIDFGATCLVAKTDPITFTAQDIGWYAVNVNANDIATMGATPKWFLCTILLPEDVDEADVERIFQDLRQSLDEIDVALCGGHTEITQGLDRTILVGQMLGEVATDRLVDNSRLEPGDDLLLTKGIAIEATAIIAREKEEFLAGKFSSSFILKAQNFLRSPGLSVVREALLANGITRCKAMHDPTEGGLATGLLELSLRGGVGLHVYGDNINVYEETEALCAQFDLDPLGAIASGSLLVGVAPEDTDRVMEHLREAGSECFVIGKAKEESYGLVLERGGRRGPLPVFDRDEVLRIFEREEA